MGLLSIFLGCIAIVVVVLMLVYRRFVKKFLIEMAVDFLINLALLVLSGFMVYALRASLLMIAPAVGVVALMIWRKWIKLKDMLLVIVVFLFTIGFALNSALMIGIVFLGSMIAFAVVNILGLSNAEEQKIEEAMQGIRP